MNMRFRLFMVRGRFALFDLFAENPQHRGRSGRLLSAQREDIASSITKAFFIQLPPLPRFILLQNDR
jgi:hypothetical protein